MESFFSGFYELEWAEALMVFGATVLSDMLWAFYIRRTNEGKVFWAALFSAIIILSGGLVVVAYVDNNWYLVPAALGAFVGTVISIAADKWRDDRKAKKA